MLAAAFRLLDAPATPVLEDLPEAIPDPADEPLACPLPPRCDPDRLRAADPPYPGIYCVLPASQLDPSQAPPF